MEFNVHPLLVHFPIAFLVSYSVLEVARFPFLTKQIYYFYLKTLLLFAGVIAAVPTILAGLLAQQYVSNHALVDLHQDINLTASFIFFILAVGYLILWINHNPPKFLTQTWWWPLKVRGANLLVNTPIVFVLTLLAVGLLTTGAALGGIIVYGPNLDPFTSFLASLLGIK